MTPKLHAMWAAIIAAEHPRLTPEYIDAVADESSLTVTKIGIKTTVVQVVLPNGFAITEHSSCVDPKNYDEALGIKYAMERVKTKIWELEGYRLQAELFGTDFMNHG